MFAAQSYEPTGANEALSYYITPETGETSPTSYTPQVVPSGPEYTPTTVPTLPTEFPIRQTMTATEVEVKVGNDLCAGSTLCQSFSTGAAETQRDTVPGTGPTTSAVATTPTPSASSGSAGGSGSGSNLWLWLLLGGVAVVVATSGNKKSSGLAGPEPEPLGKPTTKHTAKKRHVASLTV
ncbi:hypothetical protein [Hymenobacter metallilatus]|uniref:Uncharacterized protein n=1 Tax=Hymenobacter metallilatus TaxID=2493666 RepID=A0A428IYH0_9BACT|nr:hypothetical protein [Hymenobacter metallilatus]RSK24197.1 hypothetical protein EI290_20670 [Hymenobacter metallilatus]